VAHELIDSFRYTHVDRISKQPYSESSYCLIRSQSFVSMEFMTLSSACLLFLFLSNHVASAIDPTSVAGALPMCAQVCLASAFYTCNCTMLDFNCKPFSSSYSNKNGLTLLGQKVDAPATHLHQMCNHASSTPAPLTFKDPPWTCYPPHARQRLRHLAALNLPTPPQLPHASQRHQQELVPRL
jgi:hypothetical protein